jgi:SAM-dependent methyltransferase
MGLLARLRRSSHIHGDVAGHFGRFFSSGRVLDIPVGGGDNARPLAAAGFEVWGADIVVRPCGAPAVRVQQVDMTRPLPYASASFDGILHSEGIEHVDNQLGVLKELVRVLKPGGVMIVTTPNLLHLEGRLFTMLTGHPRNRGVVAEPAAYWDDDGVRGQAKDIFGHAFLIDAFQLRFYLIHVGLRVIGVDTARYSWKSLLLAPFLYPVVWLATQRMVRRRRSRLHPAQQRELLSQILSPALIFGRKAILVARKPTAP